MDPTQPAPDPQALQMLMALMGGGSGNGPAQGPLNQAASVPTPTASTAPLANGQNASLGAPAGTSLGTPQDAYAAMFQAPQMGAGY